MSHLSLRRLCGIEQRCTRAFALVFALPPPRTLVFAMSVASSTHGRDAASEHKSPRPGPSQRAQSPTSFFDFTMVERALTHNFALVMPPPTFIRLKQLVRMVRSFPATCTCSPSLCVACLTPPRSNWRSWRLSRPSRTPLQTRRWKERLSWRRRNFCEHASWPSRKPATRYEGPLQPTIS